MLAGRPRALNLRLRLHAHMVAMEPVTQHSSRCLSLLQSLALGSLTGDASDSGFPVHSLLQGHNRHHDHQTQPAVSCRERSVLAWRSMTALPPLRLLSIQECNQQGAGFLCPRKKLRQ